MFWLCKGREISRNNHRSRHMSCHRRQNNPFPVSSKGPLVCHEAGVAPWVLETFWYILGIFWCNLLCPHQSLSSTYVVWHFPVPCLLRDGLRVDGLDTPLGNWHSETQISSLELVWAATMSRDNTMHGCLYNTWNVGLYSKSIQWHIHAGSWSLVNCSGGKARRCLI